MSSYYPRISKLFPFNLFNLNPMVAPEDKLDEAGGGSSPQLTPVFESTTTTKPSRHSKEQDIQPSYNPRTTTTTPTHQQLQHHHQNILTKKEDESIVGILNLRTSADTTTTKEQQVATTNEIVGLLESGTLVGPIPPAALENANTYTNRSCTICRKHFRDRSSLRTHMRSHTGERPYKCEICGKGFTQGGDVKIHKRTHTGEKPYACSYPGCNRRFTQSSSMRQHAKLHGGVRMYVCEFSGCGKKFTRKFACTQHRLVHSKVKPIQCMALGCTKRFVRTSGAKKHYWNAHKDLIPEDVKCLPPEVMYKRILPDSADADLGDAASGNVLGVSQGSSVVLPVVSGAGMLGGQVGGASQGMVLDMGGKGGNLVAQRNELNVAASLAMATRILENENVGDALVVDDITAQITSSGNPTE